MTIERLVVFDNVLLFYFIGKSMCDVNDLPRKNKRRLHTNICVYWKLLSHKDGEWVGI